jgi:hypothetical protein
MFVLKKKLKAIKQITHTSGKWPETMGNGFFVDSNYLIPMLVEMLKNKIFETYNEHKHAQEYFDATEDLTLLLSRRIDPKYIYRSAIQVFGKMNNRELIYLQEGFMLGL